MGKNSRDFPELHVALETIVGELRGRCASGGVVSHLPTGAEDLIMHAQIYHIAEKYFVKGLQKIVCEKFAECLDDSFVGCTLYEAVEVIFTTTSETDTGLHD